MLVGPLVLGLAGITGAALSGWLATTIVGPAVASVTGHAGEIHLGFAFDPADPALWLSLATWALAVGLYWQLEPARTLLRRIDTALGWSFDRGFDAMMGGLLALSHGFAGTWQNGRLRFYLAVLFAASALGLLLPLVLLHGLPAPLAFPALEPVEWAVIALAIIGVFAVIGARTLRVAIVSLGVQGLAMALIYLLFGAPDLSFTQFMVETLSVVMFALVMTRLDLDRHPRRRARAAVRDAALALLCGGGVAATLLAVLDRPMNTRLGDFFAANAAAVAHGRNIVNVILVDFRGLDTLGEISVVLTAGVAILALIATGRSTLPTVPPATKGQPLPRRRRSGKRRTATP